MTNDDRRSADAPPTNPPLGIRPRDPARDAARTRAFHRGFSRLVRAEQVRERRRQRARRRWRMGILGWVRMDTRFLR